MFRGHDVTNVGGGGVAKGGEGGWETTDAGGGGSVLQANGRQLQCFPIERRNGMAMNMPREELFKKLGS